MRRIVILEIEGTRNHWFVESGGRFSSYLGSDEALGVVAAILCGVKPPYLGTYEDSMRWREWSPVSALLPAHIPPRERSEFVIYRRELVMNGRGIDLLPKKPNWKKQFFPSHKGQQ